jgi:hypothetical protein
MCGMLYPCVFTNDVVGAQWTCLIRGRMEICPPNVWYAVSVCVHQ